MHLLDPRIQQALHILWQSNNEGVCRPGKVNAGGNTSSDAFWNLQASLRQRLIEGSFYSVK